MNRLSTLHQLKSYHRRGFCLVPLKPKTKIPLVKWKDYRLSNDDFLKFLSQSTNWAVRCDESFHALDFDDAETYERFIQGKGSILKSAPTVRTSRGYHVWFKPKKAVTSFNVDGIEVKGLGSLIVVPPSVHPGGIEYRFEKPPNGKLPEIDLESLFGVAFISNLEYRKPATQNTPSDFALRYGKSPYPQSMCGKATKILTRSDEEVKHMLSLRCWKWHCPKCASLLKRYWQDKLGNISFRFILRLPTVAKPSAFLRHIGKPDYVHIVANGESWLFLVDGEAESVWAGAKSAGYDLIAGDVAGDPTHDDVVDYLEQALCAEDKPLNTRRKITHSRKLSSKVPQGSKDSNESKQNAGCSKEGENMDTVSGKEAPTWSSEVVIKPIEQVAKELEREGWHVLWKSEAEAIAIKDKDLGNVDMDIVELMQNLGIKLKKAGKEYIGLCPFHSDRNPSLSVNREKGIWHCFGCGRGGNVHQFIEEWQRNSA